MSSGQRKPKLAKELQEKLREEYSLGAKVSVLALKYGRSKSIVSRLVRSVPRTGEKLATKLALLRNEIGSHGTKKEQLILQRSQEIHDVLDKVIKGTNYITGRTLRKLRDLPDKRLKFGDLQSAQNIMNKAHSIVVSKGGGNDDDDDVLEGIRVIVDDNPPTNAEYD